MFFRVSVNFILVVVPYGVVHLDFSLEGFALLSPLFSFLLPARPSCAAFFLKGTSLSTLFVQPVLSCQSGPNNLDCTTRHPNFGPRFRNPEIFGLRF